MLGLVKMPYFGVRVIHKTFIITVKIHGPLDTFELSPIPIKEFVNNHLDKQTEGFNIVSVAHDLAEGIADGFLDGERTLWVEVEVSSSNNLIFGSSAEKILLGR